MSVIPDFKIGLWNAWLFMSVFVLQMIVMMLADKSIREKSHVPAEARISRLERSIGIIGNVVWFAALVYSVFLPLRLGSPWFYIGLTVFLMGSALMATATINFISTPADRLIGKGAYRFSRHPMYMATFFICLGTGFAAASWIFVAFALLMALCFYQEALIEERYCSSQYIDKYEDYVQRTPRWFAVPKKHGERKRYPMEHFTDDFMQDREQPAPQEREDV
jgi:protein-S-isoprenylcysteine O-methyltransferase Ste14